MGASARSGDVRGDTIAAVATASGRGALAVVRLSGPRASEIAAIICRPWPLVPRRATRTEIIRSDGDREPLDDAVVTHFPAPNSFTGEDVVELSVHGGSYVSAAVLGELVKAGARPALPGEFTERAVRAGRLDMLQAEAIADLIDARSRASHRTALRQLSGALSYRLEALRGSVLDVEAMIAYEIDFPEEDDGPMPRHRIQAAGEMVLTEIHALLGTLPRAELGRDGVMVVLAGAPNAGKSSLFNVFAGDARAIVSDIPGTTRDAIELLIDDQPYAIRFVDTAGLRNGEEPQERLGVEVSERRLRAAHLILLCADNDAALMRGRVDLEAFLKGNDGASELTPIISVRTKIDLLEPEHEWGCSAELAAVGAVAVSSKTGRGVEALREVIRAAMSALCPDPPEELPVVTRARHALALTIAREEISAFLDAWRVNDLPAPVVATHLRAASHALDELLGAVDVEEIMERVFRTFCVGK